MDSFDLLHPGLQHHIVNSLGWRELRPFQEEVIPPILDGEHVLVIAPTAGGKTEAAILPVLSRMLSEDWRGLSTLYLCPIKALLNNLHIRLSRYATLVGRSCAIWHGDTTPSERSRIIRQPPDILLTTPESLEVMLVSRKTDPAGLLAQVRTVIVDELHAFAGDDRGWHLVSVLQRVSRLADRELQRIGLSATVGNPDAILAWLTPASDGKRRVVAPHEADGKTAAVQLDYVGSVDNAAIVISRLHRGEKRLVFVDSRSRAEVLGSRLRELEVKTYVTHSSLSKEQRGRAEAAFASENDCVIVATSALELGIDVGDLDRVIQIDAPTRVASLLQRMGRTGRREGAGSNCLFLATNQQSLLLAAGLIDLWQAGYVESILPPLKPYHVFAQQIMALALQLGGLERRAWRDWIGGVSAFSQMANDEVESIIEHMISCDILWDDSGLLWFGKRGEQEFGYRNFMELLSVFTSEPLFTVRCGRADVGFVHELSFARGGDSSKTLLLGGRAWLVTHLDWQRRIAHVEPAEHRGRSRWLGSGQSLSYDLCQAVRSVLASEAKSKLWSRRASGELLLARQEFSWVTTEETAVVSSLDGVAWWTFAGGRANTAIRERLMKMTGANMRSDGFSVSVDSAMSSATFSAAVDQFSQFDVADLVIEISDELLKGLKFTTCLPEMLAREILRTRLADPTALSHTLSKPVRHIRVA